MPSTKKLVTVRLSQSELSELKTLPGTSNAARLRTLIFAAGATDRLAEKIANAVAERLTSGEQETQRLIKALGPILNQLYQKLSEQIHNRSAS